MNSIFSRKGIQKGHLFSQIGPRSAPRTILCEAPPLRLQGSLGTTIKQGLKKIIEWMFRGNQH